MMKNIDLFNEFAMPAVAADIQSRKSQRTAALRRAISDALRDGDGFVQFRGRLDAALAALEKFGRGHPRSAE
ncbi:MAG: hypothetical protein RQ757_06925 [Pseudomonadales bacterium]|nr:hypothetical protein [Pseudomonadales bacterium]